MNNLHEYNTYIEKIKVEFPKFDVVEKQSSLFMKIIFWISLMPVWNPYFMDNYVTTMFGKVYMPKYLIGTTVAIDVLRHEVVHLHDMKKYPVLFELTYLLFPLPIIITGRAFWEFRGYCESIRAENDRYGAVYEQNIDFYVEQFTGPNYLWMCPFKNFVKSKFLKFAKDNNIKVI